MSSDSFGDSPYRSKRSAQALVFILISAALAYSALASFRYGRPGTLDFIQYWTAFQAVLEGTNPYDPESLRGFQRALGRTDGVILYWGPPWLLVLQWPLLKLPFALAARIWFLVNSVLLALAAGLTVHLYRPSRPSVPMLAGILSVPAFHCLYLGQTSLLLAMGVVLVILAVERDRPILGGLGLTVLTIKPHLFLLLAVLILWRSVRFRTFRLPAWGIAWLSLFVAVALVVTPGALEGWWDTLRVAPRGVPSQLQWRTATVTALVRSLAGPSDQTLPGWPLAIVPLVAMTGLLLSLAVRQLSRIIVDRMLFHLVLPISLAFAPFGWFFDSAVLIPTQVAMLRGDGEGSMSTKVALLFGCLVALQVISLSALLTSRFHHELFWYPLVVLSLWIVTWVLHGETWS